MEIRLTQDGRHVLSHHASVTNAAGQAVEISQHPWATLREVDVGSVFAKRFAGERLLSVQDCFALCKGRLNLRLNCGKVNPQRLVREILDAGMEAQVVVSGDLQTLVQVRLVSAGKVAIMAAWRPPFGLTGWAITNGLAVVEVDAPELTPAVCQAFRRAGIKVQARLLDSGDGPAVWDRVMAAGLDWLETDLPEEVLAHALWKRLTTRPVKIAFHRGAGRYAPENTLAAFDKAARMHADFIEFDVRATRDGVFVLLHDSRLNRTTDGLGPLDQIPADAARKLSAGVQFGPAFAAERIPTLDEFLTAPLGTTEFYLDAKAIPPAALVAVLERHNVVARTVVYQSPQYLAQLKTINPQIRGLAPLSRAEDFDALSNNLHPYGVDVDWGILSRELIARCHTAGVKVFSDALDDHERIADYRQAIEWGIDVIQTDHPLRVMRAIELGLAERSSEPPGTGGMRDRAR